MKKAAKLFLLVGTLGLVAVGCSRTPEQMANKVVKKATKKLDLNEDQVAKLEKIKVAFLEERKAHKAKKDQHKEMFEKFVLSERLDKAAIKAKIENRKDKFDVKFEKYFPLIQDFHASLNDEQKQKVLKYANKFWKKKHRH